jgi:hypothetical protein
MKYVNPVLEAGTNKLVNTITGNPFGSVEFKDEKKVGKNEKRRMKAREEQEYQDARKREQDEYEYSRPRRSSRYYDDEESEDDYSPPPPRRRRGRPKKQHYYEEEYDLPTVPQRRVEPKQEEQLFYGFNAQPSSYQRYNGQGLKKKMLGKGTGKKLGANLGRNLGVLADAGTNKLVNMIGTGTSCGGRGVKGSPEAKAYMAAIRAKRIKK